MTLRQLAKLLLGEVNGTWINFPGPGHSCSDRSLGLILHPNAPDGFWLSSFAGDDLYACRQHVRKLLAKVVDGVPLDIEPTPAAQWHPKRWPANAQALWEVAQPIGGTLAGTSLSERKCAFPLEQADVLRFHPHCPFGSNRFPAMIAIMRDILTDEPRGIHRTALADDGKGKRSMPDNLEPRMMLGSPKGAAIKLQPHNGHLGIAEGAETAMSASHVFGMPVWSVMSAPGIRAFPLIPGVTRLTIFADHDEAGLSAARICRRRYRAAGIECEVRYPPLARIMHHA